MRGCWVATTFVTSWRVSHHICEGPAGAAAVCGDCWALLLSWLAGCSPRLKHRGWERTGATSIEAAGCAIQIVAISFVAHWVLLSLLAASWHCSTVSVYHMVPRLEEMLAELAFEVDLLMEAAAQQVKLPSCQACLSCR